MAWIRKFASLLATIGVLLHAGLIVRHNSLMAAADYERAALADAFGVICHSQADTDDPSDRSDADVPSKRPSHCPICLGFSSAAAVLPELPFHSFRPGVKKSWAPSFAILRVTDGIGAWWPPGRGPPSIV